MLSLTLGTRASPLAVAQANIVANLLTHRSRSSDLKIKIKRIKTEGDRSRRRLSQATIITGKDIFTKSIDDALFKGEIDIAVHSLKDVPIESHESNSFEIAAFPKRESPYDALLSRNGETLASLRTNANIGTSSARRAIQIKSFRPDLNIVEIRGNLHTRLKKLKAGSLDAIVLARAGLKRLNLIGGSLISRNLMLPAAGQGCLGVVVRKDDSTAKAIVSRIDDENTRIAVTAERSFCRELGGGCNLPIAAFARITRGPPKQILLEGLLKREVLGASNSGLVIRSSIRGSAREPDAIGKKLAWQVKRLAAN